MATPPPPPPLPQAGGAGRVRLAPLGVRSQALEDLLMWREPRRSAAYAAAGTAAYLLLEWSNISLLTLAANLAFLAVAAGVLAALAARFLGRPPPPLPALLRDGVPPEAAAAAAERGRRAANAALALAGRLLGGQELGLSARAAAALWLAGSVGRVLTLPGLAYTAAFFAFTLPRGYEWRKAQVDAALAAAGAKLAVVAALAPPAVSRHMSRLVGAAAGGAAAGAAPAAPPAVVKKDQ